MLLRPHTPRTVHNLLPKCACILIPCSDAKARSLRSDQLRTMLPCILVSL